MIPTGPVPGLIGVPAPLMGEPPPADLPGKRGGVALGAAAAEADDDVGGDLGACGDEGPDFDDGGDGKEGAGCCWWCSVGRAEEGPRATKSPPVSRLSSAGPMPSKLTLPAPPAAAAPAAADAFASCSERGDAPRFTTGGLVRGLTLFTLEEEEEEEAEALGAPAEDERCPVVRLPVLLSL